jgi:hypothetical protein
MISIKTNRKTNKNSNSLLQSKTRYTKTKNTKTKNTKTKMKNAKRKKNKTKQNIDKFCNVYKNDINGKSNKKLYKSCKINKYCRKYKCQDIDIKLLKAKQKNIGNNYNKIIFDKIKLSCPQNIIKEDEPKIIKKQNQCVNKTIKQIFKDNNLEEIYKKSLECDNTICAKEKKIFNINLFKQRQIKFKKSDKTNNIIEVDNDLIVNGDL